MTDSEQVVLVVDDNVNDRILLKYAFHRAASQIDLRLMNDAFQAEDYLLGRGAYADRIANPLPSLLLLDLKLPRRSGLEFLAWLQNLPAVAKIPVIVLSSSQETCDIERAYERGARSFLVKSVDLDELMRFAEGIAAYAMLLSRKPETAEPRSAFSPRNATAT